MQARLLQVGLAARLPACLLACLLVSVPQAAWPQSSQDLTRALQLPQAPAGKTRGIRPSPDTAGPETTSPAPASGPAHAAAQPARPPSPSAAGSGEVSITVEFRTGSAQLSPSAMRILNSLGGALSSPQLAGNRFRIEGHTDTVGAPEVNKALSEQRATAVVAYLAEKFHIDRGRLEAVGLGEAELLVPTPPQTPEARNRRVRVVNLGA